MGPPHLKVPEKRLRLVLGQHEGGGDVGIGKVAENEVDDPILPTEGDRRLAPLGGQGGEALAPSAPPIRNSSLEFHPCPAGLRLSWRSRHIAKQQLASNQWLAIQYRAPNRSKKLHSNEYRSRFFRGRTSPKNPRGGGARRGSSSLRRGG